MRVAHLVCLAPPEIGGMGRVASEEVIHLNEKGIEARLFAPCPHEALSPAPSHVEQVTPYWRIGNAAMLPSGPILAWRPDILHVHYPFYGTAEAWLWRTSKIPIVVTFHMDATPAGWKGRLVTLQARFFQVPLLRRADTILVSSRDYVAHSRAKSLIENPSVTITELPLAIDTEKFRPAQKEPSSSIRFLFVGGMDEAHYFKGVPELLSALSGITDVNWSLTLVGDGMLRSVYEAHAKQLGIAKRVIFVGRVPEEALISWYQQSDILLFPSTTGAEAFGLVAVEAAACGLPVIASDLPGVRTVVRSEQTGLLVPPRDVEALRLAMKRLLEDPGLRQRLGEAARLQAVERYSWPTHIASLQKVYQRLCASRS